MHIQQLRPHKSEEVINAQWIKSLRRSFNQCAVTEFPDEGPVQYWTTWYLHQARYPRTFESRILRLDRFHQHWYNDLRHLWNDLIDQSSAAWVHIVSPTPPSDSHQNSAGHVILVQGVGEKVPTVLTAVFDHPTHRRIWHRAAFVSRFVAHDEPIDILGIQRWVSTRTCHFRAGTADWITHENVEIQPGEAIIVTILPLQSVQSTDTVALMQIASTSTSSSSVEVSSSAVEVPPSLLTSPRTRPYRIDHRWKEQIVDLFDKHAVVEMEEEGKILYIWTWFINHHTKRECREPEVVRLTVSSDHWSTDILAPWATQLQKDAPTQINIVSPFPWNDKFRIDTLHVMIEQHPSESSVAGIITTFLHESKSDKVHQMAFSLRRWLCTHDIINRLEINHLCDVHRCTATAGIKHFDMYIRHDVYSAISIELHIQPPSCEGHWHSSSAQDVYARRTEELDDITNFLQVIPEYDNGPPPITIHLNRLQCALSHTLRLLQDGPIEETVGNYEVPIADHLNLHRNEAADDHHLDDLHETWYQLSPVFAASEEEATVAFMTWFVHFPVWTSCHQPRLLRLPPQRNDWDRHIRMLWRDRFLPGQSFEVSIVHPQSESERTPQLLIHQGIDLSRRGVVISSFVHEDTSHLQRVGAFVIPRHPAFADLVRWIASSEVCQSRVILCLGFLGQEPIDEHSHLRPQNGAQYEIHIVERRLLPFSADHGASSDAVEPDESEVSSFMQVCNTGSVEAPGYHGINLPEQPHESTPFQFHANAPAFVPGIPWDFRAHDEFVQDLYSAWNHIAVAGEQEERSCYVLTWFVDHHSPNPHGRAPRRVRLFSDLHNWRTHLWRVWQDHIILGQELEYEIVTPMPYTTDRRVAAHVIIIQRPHDTWVTSVVTLFDERALQSIVFQLAITTHEHILIEHLAQAFGIAEVCFGSTTSFSCLGWYRDQSLRPGAPIPGRSGMSIYLLMRHLPVINRPHVQSDTDVSSMFVTYRHQRPDCSFRSAMRRFDLQPWTLRTNEQHGQDMPTQLNGTAQLLTPIDIPNFAGAPVITPPFALDILEGLRTTDRPVDQEAQEIVVRAWYIHHTHRRFSRIARYLHLSGPPPVWHSQIVALWFDRIVPFEPIDIHVVKPSPFRGENEQHLAFDVILSQGLNEQRFAGLVSIHPSSADPTIPHFAAALSFRAQVSGAWIVRKLAFQPICQMHRCQLFHRWTELPLTGEPTHVMSAGDGFQMHIYRQAPQPAVTANQAPGGYDGSTLDTLPPNDDDAADGPVLLQLSSRILEDAQSSPLHTQDHDTETPVRLIGLGGLQSQIPSFLTVQSPPTLDKVCREIMCFGHFCRVDLAANLTLAVCSPEKWPYEDDKILLLFTDLLQTHPDDQSAFLTLLDQGELTELQLMVLLHKFGFEKAVIQRIKYFHASFAEVTFQQAGSQPEVEVEQNRKQNPIPIHPAGDRNKHRPMWTEPRATSMPQCLLDLGLSQAEMQPFFHSDHEYLCDVTEGLMLPDVTKEAIASLKQHKVFDRLIIYADGSSQSKHRHVAPELNEELDVPDAWCFVVLGETIVDSSRLEYTLLGWHTQQVRYSQEHKWFIGANHVGASIAEREALTWAFLWRIGFDSCLPTVFRSDSLMTIGQADGAIGPAVCDQSFQTLRGCYQILKAALGDDVQLDHVFGHMNDPWNEMTDALAKHEAKSSFFLPRPNFDMPKLLPKIPFLWMIFSQGHGVPPFVGRGFDIHAPELPVEETPINIESACSVPVSVKTVLYKLSVATANVQSLGAADQGFAGKLDYLRTQFVDQHLNFVGIQEARSSEGVSTKQGVLRLCSGHAQGKWGLELWVNLHQPFAHIKKAALFFRKQDFHVAHRDPRRLLVHIRNDYFTSWCLVAHAPQSGIAMTNRKQWWEETRSILHKYLLANEPLFVCIDANAAPGMPDGEGVFSSGFRHSSGTPFLRDFLDDFELCLPLTSDVHQGTTTTWTSPDDGEYTIDYVAIPRSWQGACTLSSVLMDFDLANVNLDHSAVALDMQWTQHMPVRTPHSSTRNGWDRSRIGKDLDELLGKPVSCSWDEDVESHANKIAEHVRAHLVSHCRQPSHSRRNPMYQTSCGI